MPNRIIRESCRTSPNLDQVSDLAERVFWRLTTVADDYGRFDAHPNVVACTCFPLRQGMGRRIEGAIQELAAGRLIQLYTLDGRRYGAFITWSKHQRTRTGKARFPNPPPLAASCGDVPPVAALNVNVNVNENVNENAQRATTRPLAASGGEFAQFWSHYPRRVGKADALKAWRKLQPDAALVSQILRAITEQSGSPQWREDGGKYIPHPSTWLNGRRWEDQGVALTGAAAFEAKWRQAHGRDDRPPAQAGTVPA